MVQELRIWVQHFIGRLIIILKIVPRIEYTPEFIQKRVHCYAPFSFDILRIVPCYAQFSINTPKIVACLEQCCFKLEALDFCRRWGRGEQPWWY